MMQGLSGYGQTVWESYWVEFQYSYIVHAGFRMLLLAACLSLLAFVEIRFLQAHEGNTHLMMSRAMTLGVLLIIGIEVTDFFWTL